MGGCSGQLLCVKKATEKHRKYLKSALMCVFVMSRNGSLFIVFLIFEPYMTVLAHGLNFRYWLNRCFVLLRGSAKILRYGSDLLPLYIRHRSYARPSSVRPCISPNNFLLRLFKIFLWTRKIRCHCKAVVSCRQDIKLYESFAFHKYLRQNNQNVSENSGIKKQPSEINSESRKQCWKLSFRKL